MSRPFNVMGWGGQARRLLMLAYHFPPETKIGAARPYRFARYLEQSGCTVSVVSAAASADGLGRIAARASDDRRPGTMVRSTSALLRFIERQAMPYRDYLPWVPHAVAAASARLEAEPDQVLFSTSPPVATHLAALALKWTHGLPWIADFRDPLWGNPTRTARRAAMVDPLLECLVFQNADAVIANTDAVAALWARRYPRWASKIHVIWNGFDPEDRIESTPRPQRAERVIAHVGELYGTRTPVPLAASLQRLLAAGELQAGSIQLRLVGPIDDGVRRAMDRPALHHLQERCQLHVDDRAVPQAEARQEMLRADWLVVLDLHGERAGLQLPAKVFDYVRACRPILALTSPGSATERVLARSGAAYACIDPAAPPAVMDAQVASFLRQPSTSCAPSPAFWAEFDARHQTAALARIIGDICAPLDECVVEGMAAASPQPAMGYGGACAA
jgi:glycosyltransferase involved in cell wall biosynthesis